MKVKTREESFCNSSTSPRDMVGWGRTSVLRSHWSRTNDVLLSLVKMVHSVALPALLCHKEPPWGFQSPFWDISCLLPVLHGIRVVGGFGWLELPYYGTKTAGGAFLGYNNDTDWRRLIRWGRIGWSVGAEGWQRHLAIAKCLHDGFLVLNNNGRIERTGLQWDSATPMGVTGTLCFRLLIRNKKVVC